MVLFLKLIIVYCIMVIYFFISYVFKMKINIEIFICSLKIVIIKCSYVLFIGYYLNDKIFIWKVGFLVWNDLLEINKKFFVLFLVSNFKYEFIWLMLFVYLV